MKQLQLTPEQLAILASESEVVVNDSNGALVGTATFTRIRLPAASEPTSHRHLGYTSMSRVRARMEKLIERIEKQGEMTSAEAIEFVSKLREAEATP